MFYCRNLYKLLFFYLSIVYFCQQANARALSNDATIGHYRVIAYYANELVRDRRRELSHRQIQGIISKGFSGLNAANRRNGLHHQYDLIDVIPLNYDEVRPHAMTRLQDQLNSSSMLAHMQTKHTDTYNHPNTERAPIRVFFSPRFESVIDGQAYIDTLSPLHYATVVSTFPTNVMDSNTYQSSSWLSVLAHEIGHAFGGGHEFSFSATHGFINPINTCKSIMMSYSGAGLDTHLLASNRNYCLGTQLYSHASGDTVAHINAVTQTLMQQGLIQSAPLYKTPVTPEADQYLNLHMALINLRRLIQKANQTYGSQYWFGDDDIPNNFKKFVQLAYLQNYGKETKLQHDFINSPYSFKERRRFESQGLMQELRTDYPRVRSLYDMLLVAHWLMLGMEKYVQGHHTLNHFYHDMKLLKRWLKGEFVPLHSGLKNLITAMALRDRQAKIKNRGDFTRLGELLKPSVHFSGAGLANSKRRLSGIFLKVHQPDKVTLLRLKIKLPEGAEKLRVTRLIRYGKAKKHQHQNALKKSLLIVQLKPRQGNISLMLSYQVKGRLYRQPVKIRVRSLMPFA